MGIDTIRIWTGTLAHKTGVTQRVITYYERETPFPPSSILPALAKALNTTTDNILGVDKKNGEQKGTIPPRLARKLESVYTFPKKDQKTLILFLEALEAKQKVNSK
ncbi:MAG: helix-turn-helix transcriptional regulator [Planctomycetes bacterium]|nr:helix-turn-helix transcriptional regulator [Planctomycetota bacterium]